MHEAAGLYQSTSADDLEKMPLDDSNLLIASTSYELKTSRGLPPKEM